jgi:predicted nucleotidyltransferase
MKQLRGHWAAADKDRVLLTRCRTAIESIEPSAEMILYGSRARGDAERESDYDFLILTDGEVSLAREDTFRRQLYPLEMETGAVFTVILVSRADWGSALYGAMPFYQNVQRDGIIL